MTRGHSAAVERLQLRRRTRPLRAVCRSTSRRATPPNPGRTVPGGLHRSPGAGALHVRRAAARVLQRRRLADHARELLVDRGHRAPEAGLHRRRRRRYVGGGFEPFFGTSAAAPHLAAIAALVLSGNPGTTNAELRAAFGATALDLAPAGIDSRTGRGIVRADLALEETGATPQPLVRASGPPWCRSPGMAMQSSSRARRRTCRSGDQRRRRHGDRRQRPRSDGRRLASRRLAADRGR